jgi:8-hydroxy-5-deazaflavin:NADPH oxidoreductase
MRTAIIGVGNIGKTVGEHLVAGGERVVLAARDPADAAGVADQLGELAGAASVADAIAQADVVVLAVWLDVIRELVPRYADALEGKVVVDPSNPVGIDDAGNLYRTLPEDESAASVVTGLLPAGAHYAKAFGTLLATSLESAANRTPSRAVLFYASDDDQAAAAVQRLIGAAGFDPVKVGGVSDAARIEAGGDLSEAGGLKGRLLDADQARAALAPAAA